MHSTFDTPDPSVTVVTPPHVRRAAHDVDFWGTGFLDGAAVLFDGVPASAVVLRTSERLSVEVPSVPPVEVALEVVNCDGGRSMTIPFTVLARPKLFIRGDANLDGFIEVSDELLVLLHAFRGTPLSCEDAADADDNEVLDLTDAMRILNLLFQNGPPLAPPYPQAGADPDGAGPLGCAGGG